MNWSDFGSNVAVEFIGLVVGVPITIYVIDHIIKRREERRILRVKELVKEDVCVITNAILSSIRSALGISSTEVFRLKLPNETGDQYIEELNRTITHFGQKLIQNFETNYKKRLLRMDPNAWKGIFKNFSNCHGEINTAFSIYLVYLDPKLVADLIVVRKKLHAIVSSYSVFPEAFDSNFEKMKPNTILVACREGVVNDIGNLIADVLKVRKILQI